jgi:cellobiose-specific phosphotransferase system component IIC
MYIIISVDGAIYTGKPNDKMTAKEAAEKTYDILANGQSPALLVYLSGSGGILVLGPDVVARAHITYYDEEEDQRGNET